MERPVNGIVHRTKKTLSLLITAFLLLNACAKRQEIRPPEPPLLKEELILPEPPQQKQQEVVEIKKPEPPITIEKKAEEKYIVLNFNNASIETVIATIGELLNLNYVLTPGISGRVTIQSYKKFPVSDLMQIFQTILEMNGLTAVKDGPLYRIVPIDTAKQQPLPVELGKKLVIDHGFITQIIPLENIKASDAANTLRGLLPRGADLIIYEPSNLLILTAPPHAIVKFMKIIEALDIPVGDREGIKTFVYYVENGEAKKLIEVLKTIFGEKKGRPTSVVRPAQPQPAQPGQRPATPDASAEIEGEIVMTAYEDINAIIFKCTPRAYLEILETLKKLDIPPKQVLIEVLIAEVTLDDKLQFGIEWLLRGSTWIEGNRAGILGGFATEPSNFFETTGSGNNPTLDLTKFRPVVSSGVFANILDPERFNVLISMLSGTSKLNVLASPHILALDNKEAKIEVGSEIPIATGLVQQPSTTGGATLVSQGQIQYRTAGIILTVTPYISDKNQVTLKIAQEYSAPGAPTKIAGQEFPSFITRRANTTGIVQDGHTLVIGGLISEQATHSRSGIPLLKDIPLLGWLFGSTSVQKTKTELLVMVTPRVINSQEEADRLVNEFKERVRTIKEKIEQK
ncbi:MAG: hypothetical protein N2257_05170 [Thermodesulfovibrionales bacterium]|nr:hypothetical protein [Thermodesulfovibrionales bacterium]